MLDSAASMASILVVCTGNVCRSPLADGFLRSILRRRFADEAPVVASAGTAGWDGSPAMDESVQAAAEREVDISDHIARRLVREHVTSADLIVCMAGEHSEVIVRSVPEAAEKTFTLKELVRLLQALPAQAERSGPDTLHARVSEAHQLRLSGFEGNAYDEDIVDPLGLPLDSYRAVAWELDEWCGRMVDGLFGRVSAGASLRQEAE